jgi:hypothetical protein
VKYVSSENLKQVLQKMRDIFATKSELNEVKNQMGGGTLIEGYFKTNNSKGLYCKVLETNDKYEIWSNLKLSNSYSKNLSNLPTGKKFLGNAITFKRAYSLWQSELGGYGETAVVRFDFSTNGIECVNLSGANLSATEHTGKESDFVFLGSVIKK